VVIVEGEGAVLGVNLGHPIVKNIAYLCKSDSLFPNYFGGKLVNFEDTFASVEG